MAFGVDINPTKDNVIDVIDPSNANKVTVNGDIVVTGQLNAGVSNVPPDASVTTVKLADGALSADAAGRAKMADDYFTNAEFVAGAGGKVAANAFDTTALLNLLKANNFTTAVIAQAIPTDAIDEATATQILKNGAIVAAKLKDATLTAALVTSKSVLGAIPSLGNTIADAKGGALAVTASGYCAMTIGSAGKETTTIAQPAQFGAAILLVADSVGTGTREVTVAAAINAAGNTKITFAAAGHWALLASMSVAGSPVWKLIDYNGATLS